MPDRSPPPKDDLDQTLIQDELQRAEALRRSSRPIALNLRAPDYELLQPLGEGAFGEVWLAVNENTGRQVAIKFFHSGRGLDWPLLKREVGKLVEVATERRVVQLLEVGWEAERPYYVMEYLSGGSLADRMRRQKVSIEQAVIWFRQIAKALVYLHGKAILHCDLKPANVLLDDRGDTRLADFGQSRGSDEDEPAGGTLFYLAPEQAGLSLRPEVSSDLYSLGALFYAMLVGEPPYADSGSSENLASSTTLKERLTRYREVVEQAEFPTQHRLIPGIDTELVEIIDRCLARDPQDRFESAQQILDVLAARDHRRQQRPLMLFGLFAPLVLWLALVLIGWFAFGQAVGTARRALVTRTLDANLSTARVAAAAIDRNLDAVKRRVSRAAQQPELIAMLEAVDAAALQAHTDRLYDEYKDRSFFSWIIADTAANALSRSPFDDIVVGNNYSYREWFSGHPEGSPGVAGADSALRRRIGLTEAFRSSAEGQPTLISVAAPIIQPVTGQGSGVIAATLHLDTFHDWLIDTESSRGSDCPERFVVLLHRGQLVRHPCPLPGQPLPPVAEDKFFTPAGLRALLQKPYPANADFSDPLRPGSPYLIAAARLRSNSDWTALVLQNQAEALQPIEHLAGRMGLLGRSAAVAGGLVVAALWWLLFRVTRMQRRQPD